MSRARIFGVLLALTLLAGCGAPPAAPDESREPETVSPVYTDWSRLTPYEPEAPEALYGRFEPYQWDSLAARDDYGTLLPYLGAEPAVSRYITDRLPLYGLVTSDGRVVTEPVYADIRPAASYAGDLPAVAPFLILSKGGADDAAGNGRESQAGEFLCTVAAPDGHWVRNFGIAGAEYVDDAHLAVIQPDNSVTVLDQSGETAAYFPGSAFAPYLKGFDPSYFGYEGAPSLSAKDGVLYVEGYDTAAGDWRILCYLNIADGSLSQSPPKGFSSLWPESAGGSGALSPLTDPATGTLYYYHYEYADSTSQSTLHILDADKKPLITLKHELSSLYQPFLWNGLCSAVQNGAFCYYDLKSGDCVFRFPLRSNTD